MNSASTIHPHRPRSPKGRLQRSASSDVRDLIRQVEAGFPFTVLEDFQRASGLALGQIALLLRIPPRTLIRRRASGKLAPDESERLLRISALFDDAVRLFEGDVSAARLWMTNPKKGLGGETPLNFARTEIGAREVESLIGRLEHGVFS
jgi:putative toxin-antitoxin system antitoxin component (TIGR02293 family)